MAAVLAPPTAPRSLTPVKSPEPAPAAVAVKSAVEASSPAGDQHTTEGDDVAFAVWLFCFAGLAIMNLVDLLGGLFR